MENREEKKMQYSQWQWGQLLIQLYWELSSYVSEVWGESLCTAGRTGTPLPLISTPDSLFHTSAFLGTSIETDTAPALQDLLKASKETPLKEFLAVSRTKIHPPMPDLMRQSYTGSEQQQKGYIYGATSTCKALPKGAQRVWIQSKVCSQTGCLHRFLFPPSFTHFSIREHKAFHTYFNMKSRLGLCSRRPG